MWPRLTAVLGLVVAAVLAGMTALLLALAGSDGSLRVAVIATAVLAVLGALASVLAFRVVARPDASTGAAVPLRAVAVVAGVVGVAGLVAGLIGALQGRIGDAGLGVVGLVPALAIALLAAMTAGAAARR
jgi:hypothetical protein